MVQLKVDWKPKDENTIFHHPVERIDGIDKASGFAKYSTDYTGNGVLHVRLLTSPHAHARIKSVDVSPAEAVEGVEAVYLFPQRAPEGDTLYEIEWEGALVAAVAAETPAQAAEGVKAIKIDYEVLDHFVDEDDLDRAEAHGLTTPGRRDSDDGDPDAAIRDAEVVHKGRYGIHTITHCCLEPHGSTCQWSGDDKLDVQLSTQNVSQTAGQFAGHPDIGIDAANVTVHCDYIGGGFGSKFGADEWGIACAVLARRTGRPVQLHLDRASELKIGGTRPSAFADVTIAAKADGTIVGWDSHHWGTSGIKGSTISQMPYVLHAEHRRVRDTGIKTHTAEVKAWRAPNHPQACALTCTAVDDLAAALEMDPYDVFMKNAGITIGSQLENPAEVYRAEMEIAERLMDWKAKWKGRGQWDENGWKRGLGMALHTWGGRAGRGSCTIKIHQDGTVETFAGSQDLGTGTRTVIAQVVAETFGLPLNAVQVNIGSSKYPQSGASGGSTTVGGVSGPHRRAAIDALGQIFDKVAAQYDAAPDQLAAKDGKIMAGDREVCTWQQAARLLGPMGLEVTGAGPENDGLTSAGVGGVQMVDLSVDPETGRVRVNKYVAVQDIGTIVNPLLAKSQVLGAMIQCIAYGIAEERIMDNASGKFINANLQDYKLPRMGDIGELVVEFYEPDSQYNRGIVGLGEPPVISGGAAIANAVANAIGVRVPVLPLTPKRILDALASA